MNLPKFSFKRTYFTTETFWFIFVNFKIELIYIFQVNNGSICIYFRDMLICGWSPNSDKLLFCQKSNHGQDIQGIDCKRNILVSGSKDGTFKVRTQLGCHSILIFSFTKYLHFILHFLVWQIYYNPKNVV